MPVYDAYVGLRDAYNRRSTKRFQISVIDHPTAVTAMADFCADLAAATEAEILEHSVALKTTYSDTADAGANLDEGITLSAELTSGKRAVIKVPAPVKTPVNADGTVDITNAIITDLAANFTSGVFLVSDGETVSSILSGKLDR